MIVVHSVLIVLGSGRSLKQLDYFKMEEQISNVQYLT